MPLRQRDDDQFTADTNRLIAERLPIGVVALVAVFAVAWFFEHRAHPDRDAYFAAFYGLEIFTVCAAVLLCRSAGWRHRSRVVAVVTVVALIAQVSGYHTAVRGEGEILNMALLYLVTGTMVLVPLDWQGQLPVALAAIFGYGIAIASGVRSATPLAINVLGLGTIAALSVAGAAFLAHQRRTLWQQAVALREANAALAEANRIKNQFIANVSHELRTPLSIIVGYTDLLRDGAFGTLSAEARDTLERMAQNSRNLVHLVADLLDLTRIEAGRLEVCTGRVDLAPVFARMTHVIEPWLRGKDVRFRSELADGTWVTADGDRLEQILVNLLSNAAKFTEHGEIVLRAQRVDGTAVTIEVCDTGSGFDAAELPIMFEPFGQGANGKKVGGVGVGLSLSTALARAMGGELTAHSAPDRGSTFVLRLPVAPDLSTTTEQ